ncbi:sugar phosphate isomerase/epimerase [Erwinia sp. MMLR14_017]|uniref:sugar phosphate isomerase/epimerase family protein n=1 Tax=Erwinia sp. MMLR14_017 TaxID=3093842 RepID=UPI002990301D|nr:sugar phosphate isomerase/epimerase [Erwinia sp. MMLR14_017]MDW8845032.1 sugar phosphate isomerase/epimerase [Erwinia sp. MMLR14_017]
MKLGLVSDSLSHLSVEDVIKTAADLKLDCLEFATGNWSTAPHLDLDKLLSNPAARQELQSRLSDNGLTLSALNANGNPLHPADTGRVHSACLHKTIELAALMGVENVITMSGLPGAPGDSFPNWIVTAWPPETQLILAHQWEVAESYWRSLAQVARDSGVRICIELHGQQLAYNLPTFRQLREITGDVVGLNFDPSHIIWMGGDPLEFIRSAGSMIYHVHAKDTFTDSVNRATATALDNRPMTMSRERSWSYVTLGYGQPEPWWNQFCYALAHFADPGLTLSIEHEDMNLSRMEGVIKSVELLRRAAMVERSDYVLPAI